MRDLHVALVLVVGVCAAAVPLAHQAPPSVDDVVNRMSQYVAAYGAQAAMFVGTETYDQRLDAWPKPRRLLSEFAIVRAGSGDAWAGYRDVIKVDDQAVADRQDRLLRLLTSSSVDVAQLKQIDAESARYNIGPISRNFNVPTTVLFFFGPANIGRFSFQRKSSSDIDGVATWELEFKETRRPTLVRTRLGRDVPANGSVWVVPGDGTVVRTLLQLRNFADDFRPPTGGGAQGPVLVDKYVPGVGTITTSGGTIAPKETTERMESLARIEVTYRLDQKFNAWLPAKMSELYEGALPVAGSGTPRQSRTTGLAEYSDFKRFETSGRIVTPK